MSNSLEERWARLFAALDAHDDATTGQQLATLEQEAPDDRRLGTARAQMAARRGDYRQMVRHLQFAAGVESPPPVPPSSASAEPDPAVTAVTDPPDRHSLRAIRPGTHSTTVIRDTSVDDADWSGLDLSQLAFLQTQLRRPRIGSAHLEETCWEESDWHGGDFSRGEGTALVWSRGRWAGVVANGARLDDSRWHAQHFYTCQLMNARFERALLSETRFDTCELLGCSFTDALLFRVRIAHGDMLAPLGQVSFRGAWLIDCDLSGADLSGADFAGATLLYTAVDPAYAQNLASARVISRPLHRGADQ